MDENAGLREKFAEIVQRRAQEVGADVARVEPIRGASMTEYLVTGSMDAVFLAIRVLFAQYHPCGYGTRVHSLEIKDFGPNYVARISRANSCD